MNIKNYLEKIKTPKNLRKLNFWLVFILIISFSVVNNKLLNLSQIEYMIGCCGILVIYMIIYSIFDIIYHKYLLEEIIALNSNNMKNLMGLSRNFNRIIENEHEIQRVAVKYEQCWKILKRSCDNSNNLELSNCLNHIEKIVESDLDTVLEKIWKEDSEN